MYKVPKQRQRGALFGDKKLARSHDAAWLSLLRLSPPPSSAQYCSFLGWNLSRSSRRPRVVDAFLYNGEEAMLQLRMLELSGVVDAHATAVAPSTTFSGRRAGPPADLAPAASPAGRPVRRLAVTPAELRAGCAHLRGRDAKQLNFCRESFMRNSLARAAEDAMRDHAGGLAGSDWVLLSDVDEVRGGRKTHIQHTVQ